MDYSASGENNEELNNERQFTVTEQLKSQMGLAEPFRFSNRRSKRAWRSLLNTSSEQRLIDENKQLTTKVKTSVKQELIANPVNSRMKNRRLN